MHLFVYGTLRRADSLPMHRLLGPATFVGPGRFHGRLYDLGTYPAAVASTDDADVVHGEVYSLHEPAAALAALDRYEGCTADNPTPHEYIRTTAEIYLEPDFTAIIAQVYLYNRPVTGLTYLPSGDYLEWLARLSSSSAGA